MDGAHWYLFTLVKCIFLYAVLLKFDSKKRGYAYVIVSVILLVLSLMNGHIDGRIGKIIRLSYFYLGEKEVSVVILGSLLMRKNCKIVSCITGVICIFINAYENGIVFGLELIVCAIIVYFAGNEKLKPFDNAVFGFLGKHSYAIYLIHQNIGFLMILSLSNVGYQSWMPIIAIFNSIIVGFAFDLAFETVRTKFYFFKNKPSLH